MSKKKLQEVKPIIKELTFEEIIHIKEALEYHYNCWSDMYSEQKSQIVKQLFKKF